MTQSHLNLSKLETNLDTFQSHANNYTKTLLSAHQLCNETVRHVNKDLYTCVADSNMLQSNLNSTSYALETLQHNVNQTYTVLSSCQLRFVSCRLQFRQCRYRLFENEKILTDCTANTTLKSLNIKQKRIKLSKCRTSKKQIKQLLTQTRLNFTTCTDQLTRLSSFAMNDTFIHLTRNLSSSISSPVLLSLIEKLQVSYFVLQRQNDALQTKLQSYQRYLYLKIRILYKILKLYIYTCIYIFIILF